jgi:hypothetical protein
MKSKALSPHADLKIRIMHLKSEKFEQEESIRHMSRSILYSLHPASLARESLHELAEDRDVQVSATQTAFKMGSRFLVYKVLGRFGGVFGMVGAAVAGNLTDRFLNDAAPKFLNVVGNLLRKKNGTPAHEVVEEINYESV